MPPEEGSSSLITGGESAPAASTTTTAAEPVKNSYEATDWRHGLPDDVREDASMRSFADIPSLAKSYISTKKMMGADKVTLPNKHWTPEEHEAFHDRLGRPPLDKYEIKLPKDSKFVSQEWVKELVPIAHKAGLRPEQLEPLTNWFESKNASVQAEADTLKKTSQEASIADLKKEWGTAFDQKLSYAQTLVKEHADMKEFAHLGGDIGNDTKMIRFLAKIGEQLYKEDGVVGSSAGNHAPAEAKQQVNTIMMDADHAYNNANHPNHKAAVDEVKALYAQMYPEEKGA